MDEDIQKIKWHIKRLAGALDSERHSITALVIYLDWSEDQLERASDIFEKYDRLLEEKKSANWQDLEKELKEEFRIGYQAVKTIVNAFYDDHLWQNVCCWFAESQEPTCPVELLPLMKRGRSRSAGA